MKITDILNEDVSNTGDYQKMLSFVKANQTHGVPPEQQMALALFKELQKQKQHNTELDSELAAAEQRIDVATQRGDLSNQELGKHRTELDRERNDIDQQRKSMAQMGQAQQEREAASTEQVQQLGQRLETIKNKPGVNSELAAKLEQQINSLEQKGISADQLQDLENKIANIQQMNHVDGKTIDDLVAQIKDAEQAKQALGKDLETTSKNVNDQIAQIQKQLEHLKDVEQTVAVMNDNLNDINQDFDLTSQAVVDLDLKTKDLDQKVSNISTAYGVKTMPNIAAQMIKQQPQQAAQAQRIPAFDPRVTAQKLVNKGVLQSVDESAFQRSIAWATGVRK